MEASTKTLRADVAVIVGEALAESGMLSLLRAAAEAMALAAADLGSRCRLHRASSGATGEIAIGSRLQGRASPRQARGSGELEDRVSYTIYRGLVKSTARMLGDEGILENSLGLSLSELVSLALEAYEASPVPGASRSRVESMVRDAVRKLLRDPNIKLLLMTARDSDFRLLSGLVEGLTGRDPKGLVADELLALAASLYITGFKGLLAAYWVERLKESGILSHGRLPPFQDDMVSAVLGSVLSMVYEELIGGRGW